MKQTVWGCLAALGMAACAATAPLPAVAEETGPTSGITTTKPAASLPPAKPGKRTTYPFRGVIATVDANARTVTLTGRTARRVIAVLPETRFTRDGGPASLDDLKSGEAVGGTLRKTSEGREEALLIRIGARPDTRSTPGSAAAPTRERDDGAP